MIENISDLQSLEEVEPSSILVELGQKYLFSRKSDKKKTVIANCGKYLMDLPENDKKGFIVVDCTSSETGVFPSESFRTKQFVEKLWLNLEDNGLALINCMHSNQDEFDTILKAYGEKFDVLLQTNVNDTSSGKYTNTILIGVKNTQGSQEDSVANLMKLSKENMNHFKKQYTQEALYDFEILDLIQDCKVVKPDSMKDKQVYSE